MFSLLLYNILCFPSYGTNALPHEVKHKILYNNDENAILYDEYMVKIV